MTTGVPDELVKAAAEARCIAGPGAGNCQDDLTGRKHPKCALQAAFAKLPECEAAEMVGGKALVDHYAHNPWQTFHHEPSVAGVVLAALAREFGGQT